MQNSVFDCSVLVHVAHCGSLCQRVGTCFLCGICRGGGGQLWGGGNIWDMGRAVFQGRARMITN